MLDRLQIEFRADPEFMAMLAEIRIRNMVNAAAIRAHNEIRHEFTRARLRLGVDRMTRSDVDVLHAQCFRMARRLNLLGAGAGSALIEIVQLEREALNA